MASKQSPGVPQLLRVLNDRAALNLLFTEGPKTRAQLAEATALSKVTASQMVERLESRGLIHAIGTRSGTRGPNAQVYAIMGSYAHVVGVNVGPRTIAAYCADLSGAIQGRAELKHEGENPVHAVHAAVATATEDAGITLSQVNRIMLGTPGIVDPYEGDIGFAWDLPSWTQGLHNALEHDLGRTVVIENDVNLAAIAEHRIGAAHGVDNFVYFWLSRGLGLGVVMGGKLHRGASGAAGEIGYMPMPQTSSSASRRTFQQAVGAAGIVELANQHGIDGTDATEVLRAATGGAERGSEFLTELVNRVATGITAICTVLDPSLIVIGGEVGNAGGEQLATMIEEVIPELAPVSPRVRVGTAGAEPVLEGAIKVALDTVRDEIFAM